MTYLKFTIPGNVPSTPTELMITLQQIVQSWAAEIALSLLRTRHFSRNLVSTIQLDTVLVSVVMNGIHFEMCIQYLMGTTVASSRKHATCNHVFVQNPMISLFCLAISLRG